MSSKSSRPATSLSYADLCGRRDAPPGSSWHLFGDGVEGERGMAGFATTEAALGALAFVRRGVAFGLDYPLDAFHPPLAGQRTAPVHTVLTGHSDRRDDFLDGFWPQCSSHLDGLRHRRHHQHGFYGGVPDEQVTAGSPTIGINRWADRPIVGRGVVIDVARYRESLSDEIDHSSGEHLSVELLDATLAWQGTRLTDGDCVLIRTGWAGWYLGRDESDQRDLRGQLRTTGLDQGRDALAWLWDHHLALAASDTFAFEALPARQDSAFGMPTDHGMMHQDLLGLLGLPIGELWRLDALADDCAEHRTYDCLLVVKPLNLTGGVGSPANATALR